MYEIGEFIIYGSNGVCKVEEITKMSMDGFSKDRMYYVLLPIYSQGSKLFTPVDNDKVVMRHILKREQVDELITNIPDMEELWVPEERNRESKYKEAIRSCDCEELIRIIKTLYLRKEERIQEGKKVTAVDNKYLKLAEEQLYGEFALPLDMEKDAVEAYIKNQIGMDEGVLN